MNGLNELSELLGKFEGIEFSSTNGNSITNGQWEVSFATKMLGMPHNTNEYPLQIVIRVSYKGQYVTTWGCIDNKENALFTEWFLRNKSKAYAYEDAYKSKMEEDAKETFNKL